MKRSVFSTTARTIALVAVAIVVGACYYAVQGSALLHQCANDLRAELVSPDKRFIAAHYVRDCGAGDGFSTNVSIRPIERNFDYDKDTRLFNANGLCDLDVEWAQRVLHIHPGGACAAQAKTFTWRGVTIFIDES